MIGGRDHDPTDDDVGLPAALLVPLPGVLARLGVGATVSVEGRVVVDQLLVQGVAGQAAASGEADVDVARIERLQDQVPAGRNRLDIELVRVAVGVVLARPAGGLKAVTRGRRGAGGRVHEPVLRLHVGQTGVVAQPVVGAAHDRRALELGQGGPGDGGLIDAEQSSEEVVDGPLDRHAELIGPVPVLDGDVGRAEPVGPGGLECGDARAGLVEGQLGHTGQRTGVGRLLGPVGREVPVPDVDRESRGAQHDDEEDHRRRQRHPAFTTQPRRPPHATYGSHVRPPEVGTGSSRMTVWAVSVLLDPNAAVRKLWLART